MNFKIKTNDSNICIKTIRETKDLLEEIKVLDPKVALVDKSISENYPFIFNEFKNLDIDIFVITDPETEKNLETLEKGYYFLQKNNVQRTDFILAIGGGATTDFAGFLASTFKRGTKLCLMPTTLLGQVDACIGGKTAINFGNIKNLVGSFYNPSEIIICTEFLNTLGEQEYLTGISEIIKHALITSDDEISFVLENIENIKMRDQIILEEIISRSISIKHNVVNEDFTEKGRRKFLNFGHTFGHGIESSNLKKPMLHGHAVAIGMMMALKYSSELNFIEASNYEMVSNLIKRLGYDFSEVSLNSNAIYASMKSDKKNTEKDSISLILLKNVGEPFIYNENDGSKLLEFLERFIKDFE